jgi:hypothetical protein
MVSEPVVRLARRSVAHVESGEKSLEVRIGRGMIDAITFRPSVHPGS